MPVYKNYQINKIKTIYQREKPNGTVSFIRLGVGQPKGLMLKAKAQTILLIKKLKKMLSQK